MSETLATEICRDLKRQNFLKNVAIIALSAALALSWLDAAVKVKESANTVATNTGR